MKKSVKKRKFLANAKTGLYVTNIGKISLKNNQHCTIRFLKKENEICAMNWGMYATSSINKRLKNQGCLTLLTENMYKKKFIMIIDKKKKSLFNKYCKKEKIKILKIIK